MQLSAPLVHHLLCVQGLFSTTHASLDEPQSHRWYSRVADAGAHPSEGKCTFPQWSRAAELNCRIAFRMLRPPSQTLSTCRDEGRIDERGKGNRGREKRGERRDERGGKEVEENDHMVKIKEK